MLNNMPMILYDRIERIIEFYQLMGDFMKADDFMHRQENIETLDGVISLIELHELRQMGKTLT